MCLTRGCDDVFDNHGDPRNITMTDLQEASNAAGITVPEALANMQRGVSASLRDMTDWTGDQQGGVSQVLDASQNAQGPQLSSAPPPPSPGERSPGS